MDGFSARTFGAIQYHVCMDQQISEEAVLAQNRIIIPILSKTRQLDIERKNTFNKLVKANVLPKPQVTGKEVLCNKLVQNMTRRELLRRILVERSHLLTLGAIVILTAVYAFIFANLHLNLTGIVPSPISTIFESLKFPKKKSYEKPLTSGSIWNLIDLEKAALLNVAGNESPSKSMNSPIDILWYNQPEWENLTLLNSFLQTKCTYDNCRMSNIKTNIKRAAAVIFCLTSKMDFMPPVSRTERNVDQAWIFFYHESPVHHFVKRYRHDGWRNTMNWSMSYQMDADIFYPYGYLETRGHVINKNYSTIFHRKSKLAAWAVSHCGTQSKRDEFVSELVSHGVQIDVFGHCSSRSRLKTIELDTLINKDYKFYLSFENSFCTDYVTEKFFRYYNLDVVLIVRGGLDYEKYLPNGTFINTANFNSAKDLARFIIEVGSSEELYSNFLQNKERYVAHRDPSTFTCSLCEKLNNLDANRKTYEDHVTFIHKETCWSPTDITYKFNTIISLAFLVLVSVVVIIWRRKIRLVKYCRVTYIVH